MPAAPTLPPADATARDAFSGGADILRASGLKGPYVHFSRAGPPDAALDVDSYAPGTSASGFELRQGRAMELAPLLEVRTPDGPSRTHGHAVVQSPGSQSSNRDDDFPIPSYPERGRDPSRHRDCSPFTRAPAPRRSTRPALTPTPTQPRSTRTNRQRRRNDRRS